MLEQMFIQVAHVLTKLEDSSEGWHHASNWDTSRSTNIAFHLADTSTLLAH
jgi:hypothetical protein